MSDGQNSDSWDSPTIAERHAIYLRTLFPNAEMASSGDVVRVEIDGDRGCVVLITAESAEIRLPTVEWTMGAYGPRASTRHWKRSAVRETPAGYHKLGQIIAAAVVARRAEFRPCCFCRQEFPPEHMTGDACHCCASEKLGIVY